MAATPIPPRSARLGNAMSPIPVSGRILRSTVLVLAILAVATASGGEELDSSSLSPELRKHLVFGPAHAFVGPGVEFSVPSGMAFADAETATLLMKKYGNPTSGNEVGLVLSMMKDAHWFMVLEDMAGGHVSCVNAPPRAARTATRDVFAACGIRYATAKRLISGLRDAVTLFRN